jgi:hypothetical protein
MIENTVFRRVVKKDERERLATTKEIIQRKIA